MNTIKSLFVEIVLIGYFSSWAQAIFMLGHFGPISAKLSKKENCKDISNKMPNLGTSLSKYQKLAFCIGALNRGYSAMGPTSWIMPIRP